MIITIAGTTIDGTIVVIKILPGELAWQKHCILMRHIGVDAV
jgi:hypothetical protein